MNALTLMIPHTPRSYLQETFLDDMFEEFGGRASARWSIEYDESNPDDPRMVAFPLLHYVEVNTPHRILRLETDELSAMTILSINDALKEELEYMK